jgi:hypothetical protein
VDSRTFHARAGARTLAPQKPLGVGRWLGKSCLFGTAGTRDGQDRMVQRTGGRIAPGDILIRTEEYHDDLLLMFFDSVSPATAYSGESCFGQFVAEHSVSD